MNDMHIKELRIYRAVSKLTKPIADATHDISEIAFYVLEAETGAGVVGQGYLLSFHYSPNAIEGALKDLKKFVEERDYEICQTQDIQMDYEAESEYFGIVGLPALGPGHPQRGALGRLREDAGAAHMEASRLSHQENPGVRQRRMDFLQRKRADRRGV